METYSEPESSAVYFMLWIFPIYLKMKGSKPDVGRETARGEIKGRGRVKPYE